MASREMPPPAVPPGGLRRKTTKRTYEDMDDEVSDASEYRPQKKGKKRAFSEQTRSDLVEGSAKTKRERKRERKRETGEGRESGSVADVERERAPEPEGSRAGFLVEDGKSDRRRVHITPPPPPPPAPTAEVEALRDSHRLLIARLASYDHEAQQRVLQARQDAIFSLEQEKKHFMQLQEKHLRLGHQLRAVTGDYEQVQTVVKTLNERIKSQESQLDLSRAATSRARSDAMMTRLEADRAQEQLSIVEEDLRELRNIETEDRARRSRQEERLETLPPAYGSLPDDSHAGPSASRQHAKEAVDSGALDVATFKRNLRNSFMAAVAECQRIHMKLRENTRSLPFAFSDTCFFVELMCALATASHSIKDVLKRSSDLLTARVKPATGPQHRNAELIRHATRQEYIADRLAKLLLDMIVRLIAALELRPDLTMTFTPRQRIEADLAWTAADDCLKQALTAVFNTADTAGGLPAKLFNLQYYATYINMLHTRLEVLDLKTGSQTVDLRRLASSDYLKQSEDWVAEQVATTRTLAADERTGESARHAWVAESDRPTAEVSGPAFAPNLPTGPVPSEEPWGRVRSQRQRGADLRAPPPNPTPLRHVPPAPSQPQSGATAPPSGRYPLTEAQAVRSQPRSDARYMPPGSRLAQLAATHAQPRATVPPHGPTPAHDVPITSGLSSAVLLRQTLERNAARGNAPAPPAVDGPEGSDISSEPTPAQSDIDSDSDEIDFSDMVRRAPVFTPRSGRYVRFDYPDIRAPCHWLSDTDNNDSDSDDDSDSSDSDPGDDPEDEDWSSDSEANAEALREYNTRAMQF